MHSLLEASLVIQVDGLNHSLQTSAFRFGLGFMLALIE